MLQTQCVGCHAVINPHWSACFVCGRPTQEGEAQQQAEAPSSDLLAMPLGVFQQEGQPMEIRVPWWLDTIWFAPGEADVETLTKTGVSRSRIWTARELLDLLEIPGITPEQVKKIATAKRIFEGTVTA